MNDQWYIVFVLSGINFNIPYSFLSIQMTPRSITFYTPRNEVRGGVYWNHPVRLSVCPSVDARLGKIVSSA